MNRVLTCVYCGHEYPQDTPAWGDQVLTDHIRTCPRHPMRALEDEAAHLRVTNIKLQAELDATRRAFYDACYALRQFGFQGDIARWEANISAAIAQPIKSDVY